MTSKLNILFIGPYRQDDGWGHGSMDMLKSLLKTSHNITSRPIYMGNAHLPDDKIPDHIKDTEKNVQVKYDVVIQQALPHIFTRLPNTCNIGMFALEPKSVRKSSWFDKINQMDKIFVWSEHEKNCLENDQITPPVFNINHPIDIDKFNTSYEPLPSLLPNGNFRFYFIGEYIQRKNIRGLITAFHREFGVNESVELIIKTSCNPQQVKQDHQTLKNQLRLYKQDDMYKSVQFLTGRCTTKELYQLHNSCDCFVMPSSGEACCIPALEAMGFSNPVITNRNTGTTQYVNNKNGWLVDSHEVPLVISDPPIPEVHDGYNSWYEIDIIDLQTKMREAYECKDGIFELKQEEAKNTVLNNHFYEKVGEKIEQILDL